MRTGRWAAIAVLGGIGATAGAQPPAVPTPAEPVQPVVANVTVQAKPADAAESFPAMLAEAKTAYAKVRDYTGHLIRQERVTGRLVPEQTCELRVRTKPLCVNVRVVAPREYAGEETSYMSHRAANTVRFKPPGADGLKPFATLPLADAKVLTHTRHTAADTGLMAVLDRVDRAVAAERKRNHPLQVFATEYTFAGKPCVRYEVFADHAHPERYAARVAVFVDKQTKLPVRFEAYDAAKPGGPADGERVEVQSFVGLTFNTGLGDATFER